MSLEHAHTQDGSHGPAATATTAATPGKRTQVETASAGHPGTAHPEAAAASTSPSGINLKTLQDFIAKHEGYVDHVYLDSRGFPTAGIGHLLAGTHLHVGAKVSAQQITAWFQQDVAKAVEGARRDLGHAFDGLDEARKIVVIDMVFNLGQGGSGGFHATIHAIQSGNFAQAADDMLQSLWARQVGHRAVEDAQIMRSGHLAGGGGTGGASHGGAPSGGGASHGGGGASHGGGGGGGNAPTITEVRDGKGVLKVGEQGPAVATIQRKLHIPADGIFGQQTLHAVEQFQRAHHLGVDGIVGRHTIEALDPPATAHGGHDKKTGGAPAGGGGGGGGAHGAHGKWSPAPSLAEVQSGAATLHEGEKGPAVKHVQQLLAVDTDGEFGPATRTAVLDFENQHHLERHDGAIDAHTLALLAKHPVGSLDGESHNGSAQREKLLGIARAGSEGRRPDGRCYFHVCQFLVQCAGYGKIKNPYTQFPGSALPEAHDFADFINSQGPARWGLDKLAISNPYDAPAGAIVVVKAGSPGTANPTAGDIAVADGHGNFFNGGMMSYHGRAGWEASPRAHLLGAYIPR
jgi:peptidoglycan hydrolase-like protein with peptidoglycan-binding domain/GH24 family phage-related lysozyme (muramidase)